MEQYSPSGFRFLPPVVKNILIINVLFFVATFAFGKTFGIDITDYLGLHYFSASKFLPFQFITYMFMHGSFTHILFNMFALWMFGNVLENVWGPKRFLTYYFVCGIGAALVHYFIFYFQINPVLTNVNTFLDNPSIEGFNYFLNSQYFKISSYDIQNHYNEFALQYNQLLANDPTKALQEAINFASQYKVDILNAPVVIGASGAIFGLLLAFGMMFPNSLIYIYFAIPIKAKWFVILYGGIELFSGFFDHTSNVAHFAHLGGMLFGFFLIIYWNKKMKHPNY